MKNDPSLFTPTNAASKRKESDGQQELGDILSERAGCRKFRRKTEEDKGGGKIASTEDFEIDVQERSKDMRESIPKIIFTINRKHTEYLIEDRQRRCTPSVTMACTTVTLTNTAEY